MTPCLLDVNALIALIWEGHERHLQMVSWFRRHGRAGWATCALTQSGFVRVLSQPALATGASIAELSEALKRNVAHPGHHFVPLDFDFVEVMTHCTGGVVGHRQVTDAYLLTAAIRNRMRLLTLDRGLVNLLASDAERNLHIELLP